MSNKENIFGKNGKHIHVTCAIIEKNGLVMAAQRSSDMSLPLKWEFPGGKIRPNEDKEDCLYREISEELGIQISTSKPLEPATHDYPTFTITLYPFICSIIAGEMKLHEHAAVTWLPPERLKTLDWADADLPVLAAYCRQLKN
ncbi:MAG: (deoxy)nucleoside triphosphate pyrophosphohydrolase [Desulfobulbaceae bacterium]|nr:(deoxy)nucleoside triphosphate pyrophosphohydrolase [Desulfobulbaceae bacterium]